MGEHIAIGEVFIFIVRLLARFDIEKPADVHGYDLAAQNGVILRPASYRAGPSQNAEG